MPLKTKHSTHDVSWRRTRLASRHVTCGGDRCRVISFLLRKNKQFLNSEFEKKKCLQFFEHTSMRSVYCANFTQH